MAPSDAPDERALPNFGWLRPGVIAGMARPEEGDWHELRRRGVRAVLSLTERPPEGDPRRHGLEVAHVPIVDFTAPDAEVLHLCVSWIREQVSAARPVVVHCAAGLGRTGTILAAWLVSTGVDAEIAVTEVRRARPGSLETREQVTAVVNFARSRAAEGKR